MNSFQKQLIELFPNVSNFEEVMNEANITIAKFYGYYQTQSDYAKNNSKVYYNRNAAQIVASLDENNLNSEIIHLRFEDIENPDFQDEAPFYKDLNILFKVIEFCENFTPIYALEGFDFTLRDRNIAYFTVAYADEFVYVDNATTMKDTIFLTVVKFCKTVIDNLED